MTDELVNIIQSVWPMWTVKRRLGAGSFGSVYLAENSSEAILRKSAIKVVKFPQDEEEVRSVVSALGLDTTEKIRDYYRPILNRVMDEVRLMEELKTSGAVVTIQDFKSIEKDDGLGWYILIRMELLQSLQEYRANRVFTEEEVIGIGLDICRALRICHNRNILHRDVKESNIFRSEHGTYKLGDFGISRHLEASVTNLSHKGTSSYMAPEIMRGKQYDFSVDIYALGIVLYRLLNQNRLPFLPITGALTADLVEEANQRRLMGEPLPAPVNASPALAEIILQACNPDSSKRFSSADAMSKALSRYLLLKAVNTEEAKPVAPASVHPQPAPQQRPQPAPQQRPQPAPQQKPQPAPPQRPQPQQRPQAEQRPQAQPLLKQQVQQPGPPSPEQQARVSQPVQKTKEKPAKKAGGKKIALVGLIALLVVGLLSGAFFLLKGGSAEPDPAASVTEPKETEWKEETGPVIPIDLLPESSRASAEIFFKQKFPGSGSEIKPPVLYAIFGTAYKPLKEGQGKAYQFSLPALGDTEGFFDGDMDSSGKAAGKGTFTCFKGDILFTYIGNWKNGLPNGPGVLVIPDSTGKRLRSYWEGNFDEGRLLDGMVIYKSLTGGYEYRSGRFNDVGSLIEGEAVSLSKDAIVYVNGKMDESKVSLRYFSHGVPYLKEGVRTEIRSQSGGQSYIIECGKGSFIPTRNCDIAKKQGNEGWVIQTYVDGSSQNSKPVLQEETPPYFCNPLELHDRLRTKLSEKYYGTLPPSTLAPKG